MAGVADIVHVVIRGAILDANASTNEIEEFNFGFYVLPSDLGGITDWNVAVANIAGTVATQWRNRWTSAVSPNTNGARTWFPQTVVFKEVRAYHLNAAGLTLHMFSVPMTNLDGSRMLGTANSALPPQTSLCISLYSYGIGAFNPDGRRGRGRYYLPPVDPGQLVPPGLLATGQQTAFSIWQHAFLNAVRGSSIASGGGTMQLVLNGSDGEARPVARLRVGRVIDTQRRRRGDLLEAYDDRVFE